MLITLDELARGACIGVFGGLAGACTLTFPGSALWLLPAGLAVGGCALTVPELRQEAARALPLLSEARPLLEAPARAARGVGAWVMTGQRAAAPQQRQRAAQARPRWLEVVNDQPDQRPHALILGPTGAGKTTLATALMADRGGRSVVISPKISPGAWAGAEVVTLDDDGTYAPLEAALEELEAEKRRRIVTLRRKGPDALEPLTVVLDELQQLTANVPAAGEYMVGLSSIGREIKMRLVGVGTTDDALNIRGWKASRPNYARISLDADRRATLHDGVREIEIPMREIVPLARAARLRPWRDDQVVEAPAPAPADAPLDLSDFLNDLLAQPVTSASQSPGSTQGVTATATPAPGDGNGNAQAQVTVTPDGGGQVVKVYATAYSAGRAPARRGRGLDMRARRARVAQQRQGDELRRAYAEARAAGVPSFRQAYKQLGGNSRDALAAWQAAGNQKEA